MRNYSRKPLQLFSILNGCALILLSAAMLFPFLHVLASSLSSGPAILQGKVSIFPIDFTLINYEAVLGSIGIWRAFGISAFVTIIGTAFNLLFTSLLAYGLAKEGLKGRTFILVGILFTMIFSAPLIPTYLLVKSLGLLDSLWALILPGTISAFNLIILISFFKNLPTGLVESARIDGCGDYRTWWSIVMPLSMPSLTTIGLFYAVSHWNSYMGALMYLRNPKLYPLQVKLMQLIANDDMEQMRQSVSVSMQSNEGIKMATIIVATIPILFVYPFIQKHFVKGSMLGAIKS